MSLRCRLGVQVMNPDAHGSGQASQYRHDIMNSEQDHKVIFKHHEVIRKTEHHQFSRIENKQCRDYPEQTDMINFFCRKFFDHFRVVQNTQTHNQQLFNNCRVSVDRDLLDECKIHY